MYDSNQGMSFWTVAQVARFEIRNVVCLYRFWLVVLLLSSAAISAYVLSCLVYLNIAPYNVSFIGGTPLYLLGNLDPAYFVFFQVGLLLLVFDCRHRIRSSRLEEVIESHPVRNLEFQLGRTLGYSGLVWGIVCANVLLMQLIGFVSQLFQFDFADTIQLHSMFNLLVVDAPVALLFWTSLFLVLTKLIHSRLLILLASILVIGMYYLLVLNTPFPMVDLISHSSNQTLFVSDILPELPSTTSWVSRVSTLLLVVAILGLGAWIYRRSDSSRPLWSKVIPVSALSMGVVVCCVGGLHELGKSNEINGWLEAHLNYEWNTELDVQAIHGNVNINPNRQMHIDLDVEFVLTSQRPTRALVFTLNPGYTVSTIEVNETPSKFDFKNGILEVSVPFLIEPEAEYSLKVVAMGKPNPNFAYLNAPYDYVADTNFPIQALHSFGTEGSIYDRKFVALMPGVFWYPIPGTIPLATDDDSFNSDFFDVELQVQLNGPSSWKVVGPGTSLPNPNKSNEYLTKPSIPVVSIGLFASEYVEIAHDFEDLKLALYLHKRHAKNFQAIEKYQKNLIATITEDLKDLEEQELSIPYQSVAFVEVPNSLRVIGGGWRMDRLNSLPGVVLLKERGFPKLNIKRLVNMVEQDFEDDWETAFKSVWRAVEYADDRALGIDHVTGGVYDQIWRQSFYVTGEYRKSLNLIIREMRGEFTPIFEDRMFSVYATAQAARMTGLNLPSALGIGRARGHGVFDKERLHWVEDDYGARHSIWNIMEQTALPDQTFNPLDHQQDLEILLLKSRQIASALFEYHVFTGKRDNIRRWLFSLRDEFTGHPYTREEISRHAHAAKFDIDVFLEDWLTKKTLAGFEVSSGSTTRIAKDEDGRSRLLFSFEIANTQPVSGIVQTVLPSVPIFVLGGNESKRVNVVWTPHDANTLGLSFEVRTGLSLNRGPIGFFIPVDNPTVDESIKIPDTIEMSDFVPVSNGIIVDDLDREFVVSQRKRSNSRFRFFPRDWFWIPVLQANFDGTLLDIGSSYMIPRSNWVRRTEQNAYGRYRRTVALSWVGSSLKLHPVRFSTDIPDAGVWTLDFYLHRPSNFMQYGNTVDLNLEIENGLNHWKGRSSIPTHWKMGGKL